MVCQGVLAPGWHQLETTATSYFQQIPTLSLSDCWSVANLEKILMHRNAETSVVCGEMGLDVRFHCLPGGYAFNLQQVKHKFGDGVGLVQVWCLNVRGIQRGHDVVPDPMLGVEGVGGPAQFKPVAEKVRIASCGVQTMGSPLMLKEVLSRQGTPLISHSR